MSPLSKTQRFEDIIATAPLVLVDFFADWCGPCKMLKPVLEQVHLEMGDAVRILKVDVDRNPQAAQKFQVTGVPTLILFQAGRQVWRQSGVLSPAALKQVLKTFTP